MFTCENVHARSEGAIGVGLAPFLTSDAAVSSTHSSQPLLPYAVVWQPLEVRLRLSDQQTKSRRPAEKTVPRLTNAAEQTIL